MDGPSSSASASASAGVASTDVASMSARGSAPSTKRVQESVLARYRDFRLSHPTLTAEYSPNFADISAAVVCAELFYCRFAQWLTHTYRTPAATGKGGKGKHLALSTTIEYIRKLINLAREQHGHTAEHVLFFTCLDADNNGNTNWFRRLLANVTRDCVARAVKLGEDVVNVATPMYREHLVGVCRALARHGSKDSVYRRLALALIFQACGRAGEIVTLSFVQVQWNALLRGVAWQWTQLKTGKPKWVICLPGPERHTCLYNLFADAFAMGIFNARWLDDTNNFVFPDLAKSSTPVGTTMGAWLTSLTTAGPRRGPPIRRPPRRRRGTR